MSKYYKDKKLVPSDDVSLWAVTHKDDTIEDDSWETWVKEQEILLQELLNRKKRKKKKRPTPFNIVIKVG